MGNDGGSIPDRRDLVRTKAKAEQADKANQTRAKWFFCALSKEKLQQPVASCALGKLYNRESILLYFMDKSTYGDGEKICGHLRSSKDVVVLNLTPNPTPVSPESVNASTQRASFVCPLSIKEMNGSQPFVYLSTCGCVFSHAALKTMLSSSDKGKKEKDDTDDSKQDDNSSSSEMEVCPQCAKKYNPSTELILLNPSETEEELMWVAMEKKRLEAKKSKKRKNTSGSPNAEDGNAQPPSKKRATGSAEPDKPKERSKEKAKAKPVPSLNPSMAASSRAVVSNLAMEEAKRKSQMSDAVKSLYHTEESKKRKETFMTMGTFTRYA
ncbi:DUF602-domain-containing protein [Pluteus cervinus]|uniref:DUF602-domain-containing protein n=1 Tax=Pluteus cervinus TaxID=181527 RepID=A0ACD3ASL8_9AGAR|nr:DUF602-domain-containing protein [Pluteus cervinus]